jgi:hypothetical protein
LFAAKLQYFFIPAKKMRFFFKRQQKVFYQRRIGRIRRIGFLSTANWADFANRLIGFFINGEFGEFC